MLQKTARVANLARLHHSSDPILGGARGQLSQSQTAAAAVLFRHQLQQQRKDCVPAAAVFAVGIIVTAAAAR